MHYYKSLLKAALFAATLTIPLLFMSCRNDSKDSQRYTGSAKYHVAIDPRHTDEVSIYDFIDAVTITPFDSSTKASLAIPPSVMPHSVSEKGFFFWTRGMNTRYYGSARKELFVVHLIN